MGMVQTRMPAKPRLHVGMIDPRLNETVTHVAEMDMEAAQEDMDPAFTTRPIPFVGDITSFLYLPALFVDLHVCSLQCSKETHPNDR